MSIPRQRRRLPPELRELLLRLRCPRSLAFPADLPLEYPEKASERVPLRSVLARSPPLYPRDSAVAFAVEPDAAALARAVLAVVPDACASARRCWACACASGR